MNPIIQLETRQLYINFANTVKPAYFQQLTKKIIESKQVFNVDRDCDIENPK